MLREVMVQDDHRKDKIAVAESNSLRGWLNRLSRIRTALNDLDSYGGEYDVFPQIEHYHDADVRTRLTINPGRSVGLDIVDSMDEDRELGRCTPTKPFSNVESILARTQPNLGRRDDLVGIELLCIAEATGEEGEPQAGVIIPDNLLHRVTLTVVKLEQTPAYNVC